MVHGRSYSKSSDQRLGSYRIYVQTVQNKWQSRSRWSYRRHRHCGSWWKSKQIIGKPHVSVSDIVVRGLFAGRFVGRKHAVRKLEKSDTRALTAKFAKLAVRVQRQCQGGAGVQAGPVQRDQPFAPEGQGNDSGARRSAEYTGGGPVIGGQCRHRIFQKMEWNLFGTYLSPTDWWNFRLTCKTLVPERWTWNVLWTGPKVYSTYAASRFVHALTVHPVHDVVRSITKFQTLRMAFVVMKWLGYNVADVARRCKIKSLIIWRFIF